MEYEEEYDETYAPPQEPHRPKLEDGKRYTAKIAKVEVLTFDLRPKWNRGGEVIRLPDFTPLSSIALTSFNHLSIDSG